MPTFGIGRTTVIMGLVLYSPLILIRNTVVGLQAVPGPVREAARGMGLTRRQTLMRVELPLALPSIFTGIRIVTVTTVGIATIGVLVGAEGLGTLIYTDGLNRDFLTPIVVGGADRHPARRGARRAPAAGRAAPDPVGARPAGRVTR